MLHRPVRDRPLGHPGHHVLALDVVHPVLAPLVEDRDLVVGHLRLLGVLDAVRGVHAVEHEPGGGPVHRHPDLHLLDVGPADPHVVGEHQRVADLPVVVLLRRSLDHPALDDAPLEGVEADLDVLLAERRRRVEALVPPHELEEPAVQPLGVMRVDRVLHDLHEVAGQFGPADVPHAVHHEHVEAGQLRRRLGPDVGPDQAAEFGHVTGPGPDPLAEVGLFPLRGLVQAGAVGAEQPAVIRAADPVGLHHAVGERGPPVRAGLRHQAVLPARRLEHGEVLAEQPGRLDRELLQGAGERDRVPVAPQ